MSALGHLQPVAMLLAWRLLSRVNRPFVVAFSGIAILNVCSHRKQSFNQPEIASADRQRTAALVTIG
jgi:hypothetical protein